MPRVYYYGLHKWENYLLDIDEDIRKSGESTQRLASAAQGFHDNVMSGLSGVRSSIEGLQGSIEEMRADFEWGFSLVVDRMDTQISIMAGIAKELDAINTTLGAPLDTQARELFRIGVARLREGLDDKALEAFLQSEQKNDVDFALQLYIGKLYLEGRNVINLQKATEHLLMAARYAEAKRGRLDGWYRFAAEAYFHAAVATYLEGEKSLGDGRQGEVNSMLEMTLGLLSKAWSLNPEFLETMYLRAKCCALLSRGDEAKQCFQVLADKDRRYFLKAAVDKDFDKLTDSIKSIGGDSLVHPGPLAQTIGGKLQIADIALSWAKYGTAQTGAAVDGVNTIEKSIVNSKRIIETLAADLVGIDRKLDTEIHALLRMAETSLSSELQAEQAAQANNAQREANFRDQIRSDTATMKSQSSTGLGCGFAALTYFVGGPLLLAILFTFLRVNSTPHHSTPQLSEVLLFIFLAAVVVGFIAAYVGTRRKQAPFRARIAWFESEIEKCSQYAPYCAQRTTKIYAELEQFRAWRGTIQSVGHFAGPPAHHITSGGCSVTLSHGGSNKINTIKVIREVTGLGLKEAKDLADSTPSTILRGVDLSTAKEAVSRFEGIGAAACIADNESVRH